jgi:hypothetical protein
MQFRKIPIIVFLVIFSIFLAIGCEKAKNDVKDQVQGQKTTQKNEDTLTSVKTNNAPAIDGVDEDSWKNAKEIRIDLKRAGIIQGGKGGKFKDGKTTVRIKSLYDNNNIYMRYEWEDPSASIARGPWVKEGGKLVKKPYDTDYEDKLAVFWNINNSVAKFSQLSGTSGCRVTCHGTGFKDEKTGKEIRKHFTNAPNEKLDIWHWKLTRQNTLYGPDKPGLMHDQFMDNVKYDPNNKKTKSAGRHSDPSDPAKEYVDNATGESPDFGQPKLIFEGSPVNGNPYVIVEGLDKTKPFNPNMIKTMKEGDHIPGPIAFQIKGDGADIIAKGKYKEGKWVLETSRKLKTGSDNDIQFEDLGKTYWFGISAFDNSQIGHAYHNSAKKFVFQK